MAKSENNEVMYGARSRVGNLVVFKNFGNNQTVIAKRQRRLDNPVYTEKQVLVKQRFREAVAYAKGVIGNLDLAVIYQAFAKPGISVYNLALADYCKAPAITQLKIVQNNLLAATNGLGDRKLRSKLEWG